MSKSGPSELPLNLGLVLIVPMAKPLDKPPARLIAISNWQGLQLKVPFGAKVKLCGKTTQQTGVDRSFPTHARRKMRKIIVVLWFCYDYVSTITTFRAKRFVFFRNCIPSY